MPLWVAAIIGGLIEAAGTLVGKVLVSLGIGYAVYSGIDTSIAWAKAYALSNLASLPAGALQVAGALKVGSVISIICSALIVRLTMQGLTSGSLRRMTGK